MKFNKIVYKLVIFLFIPKCVTFLIKISTQTSFGIFQLSEHIRGIFLLRAEPRGLFIINKKHVNTSINVVE